MRNLEVDGRTPQGVRGLKPSRDRKTATHLLSHSARSAWIETGQLPDYPARERVALRKECVD